jgi:magnesium transporter
MSLCGPSRTSVSILMGTPILDAGGAAFGRVREFAVSPQVDASRVEALLVRRTGAPRKDPSAVVPLSSLRRTADGRLQLLADAAAPASHEGDNFLLLERDLLDQQIIDVHGHKVVRVNDVDLRWENTDDSTQRGMPGLHLRVSEVEVGMRGAVRRLLKGLPPAAVETIACRLGALVIPWDFVDLIDRDPARRVRLKIEQDRLSKMHPSDLADILEELAPKERQALFSSLDEEVAAEALEEIDVKTQRKLIESLDSEQVAGILDEMDPGAAADLLSELTEERSDAILEEMGERERHDVEELLEYDPDSAAGLMTSDYLALPAEATVLGALQALENFDGDPETVTDVFILDADGHVSGVVPLARLAIARPEVNLGDLPMSYVVCAALDANGRKVAELFDKYNLRCLPVIDEDECLAGVVHAENVIAWLRTRQ